MVAETCCNITWTSGFKILINVSVSLIKINTPKHHYLEKNYFDLNKIASLITYSAICQLFSAEVVIFMGAAIFI